MKQEIDLTNHLVNDIIQNKPVALIKNYTQKIKLDYGKMKIESRDQIEKEYGDWQFTLMCQKDIFDTHKVNNESIVQIGKFKRGTPKNKQNVPIALKEIFKYQSLPEE